MSTEAKKTHEQWQADPDTAAPKFIYAGAVVHNHWAIGKTLTREEWDAGIAKHANMPLGSATRLDARAAANVAKNPAPARDEHTEQLDVSFPELEPVAGVAGEEHDR